jgi:divalent metal cation (Fe/Co/Zn/Cd) transporter
MTDHHDHHHASPADLASVGNRGAFIMQIGILSNLGLAVIKLLGGMAFNSKSLTADAWHSFTDVTADLLALFAIFLQARLAKTSLKRSTITTTEHLLSLMTAGVLVAAGVHLGWESGVALQGHFLGGQGSGSLEDGDSAPSFHAIWAAALTIVVKETLYYRSKCH